MSNLSILQHLNTDLNIDNVQIQNKVKNIIDKTVALDNKNKIALLLRAISCIDLTSLKGNESFEEIKNLCSKASNITDIDFEYEQPIHTAAICIFPSNVCDAINIVSKLNATGKVKVASVAADFPKAQLPLKLRINEIKRVVDFGADEIDIVINRSLALDHKWDDLFKELKLMRLACGKAKMKTILATGDLLSLEDVYIASMVAMLAGSDFIKTSTGKEVVNATLTAGIVMAKAIKDYHIKSGKKVGIKPAGGIKTSEHALQWMTLVSEELSYDWLNNDLFRIGASSLIDNIIQTILTLK